MKNILMNAEMTKAILNGRKVQTRRVLNISKFDEDTFVDDGKIMNHYLEQGMPDGSGGYEVDHCSDDVTSTYTKYKIGETIWVREPVKVKQFNITKIDFEYLADGKIVNDFQYPAKFYGRKWIENCQGIPNGCIKEMARIFLEITDVRVDRLQDIELEYILNEGFPNGEYELKANKEHSNDTHGEVDYEEDCAFEWWIDLWNKTAPKGYKWEDNPYVFVYEFKRVEK